MKTILHNANERGHANHGWLDSYHSFSFAGFHDPAKIHFGALRVLNDDTVSGGMGFGTHPHDNMEIVSIPLSGDLAHKDSMGNEAIIKKGEVQIMSAGTGIYHSEKNKNHGEAVKFLQIWVFPKLRNIEPRYDQKVFLENDRKNKFQVVVSPLDSTDGGVGINQNAWFSLGNFEKDVEISYEIKHEGNGVYAFVLEGEIEINGQKLSHRDALGISETDILQIKATNTAEVLLIDVPMSF
jgi:redox-sensitive bicupin YhaK (pirin superfamily)